MMSANNPKKSVVAAIVVMTALGLYSVATSLTNFTGFDWVRLLAFLAVGVAAAMLKVKLPGMDGSMSVNMPYILLAVARLSLPEALVVAIVSTIAQCLWAAKRMRWWQVLFNVAMMACAVRVTSFAFHFGPQDGSASVAAVYLCLASVAYFLLNTLPVAVVMSLGDSRNAAKMWSDVFMLTFPYYVLSAGVAVTAYTISHFMGWYVPLALLPIMVSVHLSYRCYFGDAEPKEFQSQSRAARGAA
jgi:hypothetical protein